MSQPSSNNDDLSLESGYESDLDAFEEVQDVPRYRKQGFSIYTMFLILSFLSLTASAIIFYTNIRG